MFIGDLYICIGDPQMFIGDLYIFIGDPQIFIEANLNQHKTCTKDTE